MTQPILQKRLEAVRKLLGKYRVSSLVLTDHTDQFYMSGFSFYPQEAVFIIHPRGIACFVRELYTEQLRRFNAQLEVFGCESDRLQAAINYVKTKKISRVGFDAAKESYLAGKQMRQAGFAELPSLISDLREIKDDAELKKLRQACRIAYLAYEYVKPRLKTGMMECEVASMLEQFMRANGGTETSFPTIVAFGENAANPHHQTTTRKLKKEEAVLMDFGCIYEGYCSDITRSWWYGKREPNEYKKIWSLVDKARKTGIKTIRKGAATRDVDANTRQVITAAGYGDYFTHRTGHGVGIDIHEEPCNSAESAARLQIGNVVTVEPGIYLPGKFGVRLEDTVAVGKTGATILTRK